MALLGIVAFADEPAWRPATPSEISSLREGVKRRLQAIQRCRFKFETVWTKREREAQPYRRWGEVKWTPDVKWFALYDSFGMAFEFASSANELWQLERDAESRRPQKLLKSKPRKNYQPNNLSDPCELFGLFVYVYRKGDLAYFLAHEQLTVEASVGAPRKFRVTAGLETEERHTFVFDPENDMNLRSYRYEAKPGQGDFFEISEYGRTQDLTYPAKARMGPLSDKATYAEVVVTDFTVGDASIDVDAIRRLQNDPNVTYTDQLTKKERPSREEAERRRRDLEEGSNAAKTALDAALQRAEAGEAPSVVARPSPASIWWYFLTPAAVAFVAWLLWRRFASE